MLNPALMAPTSTGGSWLPFDPRLLPLFVIGVMLIVGPIFLIATAAWSGWRRLARSYPGRDRERGTSVRASPILMGMTNYRGGARLTPDDSYLHFSMSLLNRLGHPPFSVPWSDISTSRDEWPWFPFKGHPVIRLTIARHQSLRLLIPLKAGERILAPTEGRAQRSEGPAWRPGRCEAGEEKRTVSQENPVRNQPRALLGVTLVMLTALVQGLQAQASDSVRICLAPASVEASTNATAAVDAVRESFTGFLTGPSLTSQPLKARLETQAREEAKQASCPFILLTTLKLVTKRSGRNLLGQVAAGAARQGAWEAGARSGTAAGRIAGSAAYGGLSEAVYSYAVTIRSKDELTLGWRLENADGTVLLEQREKQTAKSDGEDLLTPLVQKASEQIVAAAKR